MEGKMTAAVTRQTNRRKVYQYIYRKTGRAAAEELAEALSLDMRTVTESLEDLVNEGLVTAAPEENTYELNAQALYAVGVSIEQGKVYIAALDMRLQELVSRELTVPFSHTDAYYRRLVQEM